MVTRIHFIDSNRDSVPSGAVRRRRALPAWGRWSGALLTLSFAMGCAILARRVAFADTPFGGAPGLFTMYATTAFLGLTLAAARVVTARWRPRH